MEKVVRGIQVLKQVPDLDHNDRAVINSLIQLHNQASSVYNLLQKGDHENTLSIHDTLTHVYNECEDVLRKVAPVQDAMKEMCSRDNCNEKDALLTLTYVNTVRYLHGWCEMLIDQLNAPKVFSPQ